MEDPESLPDGGLKGASREGRTPTSSRHSEASGKDTSPSPRPVANKSKRHKISIDDEKITGSAGSQHRTMDGDKESLTAVFAGATGFLAAITSGWALPVTSQWSAILKGTVSALIGIAATLVALKSFRRIDTRWFTMLLVTAILFSALLVGVTWPSATAQKVKSTAAEICRANIWVDTTPTCYDKSVELIVEHFDSFDPIRHHAWDELSIEQAAPVSSLAIDGPALQGSVIGTVGRVVDVQNMGGSKYVVQLRAPYKGDLDRVSPDLLADFLGRGIYAGDVMREGSDPEHLPPELVYVSFIARPFQVVKTNQLVIVNGAIIANGTTRVFSNRHIIVPLTYVIGSAVEELSLAARN